MPSRPTQPESEPTPVTIRDYLLYCTLRQDEIGDTVFGHRDFAKNIKRKYVFEILYGIHSVEAAEVQEELRHVLAQARDLKSRDSLFEKFFDDTPMENRAEIERNLAEAKRELQAAEDQTKELARGAEDEPLIRELRRRQLELSSKVAEAREGLEAENRSVEELSRLAAQLETNARQLTRSIVANKHLLDIDFVVCPRCGSEVEQSRSSEDDCYLCLQPPRVDYSRESLVKESRRVDAQLVEANELLEVREQRANELRNELVILEEQARENARELDFRTESFVSARAAAMTEAAENRASARARVSQYSDYLAVLGKLDRDREHSLNLERRKEELQAKLESLGDASGSVQERIDGLEAVFDELVSRLHPPEFGEEEECKIDRRTFLPIFHGRRFDELSSPGLGTLVNVAHTVAHQLNAFAYDLALPNILFIDGLSEHFGEEGRDPARREAIYRLLGDTCREHGDRLQMLVADNDIPDSMRQFIRLELSEEDRLVPASEEGE